MLSAYKLLFIIMLYRVSIILKLSFMFVRNVSYNNIVYSELIAGDLVLTCCCEINWGEIEIFPRLILECMLLNGRNESWTANQLYCTLQYTLCIKGKLRDQSIFASHSNLFVSKNDWLAVTFNSWAVHWSYLSNHSSSCHDDIADHTYALCSSLPTFHSSNHHLHA